MAKDKSPRVQPWKLVNYILMPIGLALLLIRVAFRLVRYWVGNLAT